MNHKPAFLPLFMMWISHFAVDFMIGIWPIYKTMMQMDLAVVGIITAVGVCLGEGMQLFFGALSDSGHRRMILLGGLATTLTAVLYPYASSMLYLFPLFVLTCIGSGAFHPAASSIVNGLTKTRRGLFVTIFASGGMAGLALSQSIRLLGTSVLVARCIDNERGINLDRFWWRTFCIDYGLCIDDDSRWLFC